MIGSTGRHTSGGFHDTRRARRSAINFTTNVRSGHGGRRCCHRARGKQRTGPAEQRGGAADHHHHPAPRFRPHRCPDHLLLGPGHHCGRSVIQRPRPAQHRDQASLHRRAVGRGSGLERAGPLSAVERHSQQPADAMVGGRRPRQRVPLSVQQLQRQLVRLQWPAALLRTSHAKGGALRARRHVDRARRQLQRQEAQLAQRCRRPSRRQLLVHRSALWRPAL